jgi:hypothetical protein
MGDPMTSDGSVEQEHTEDEYVEIGRQHLKRSKGPQWTPSHLTVPKDHRRVHRICWNEAKPN